MGAPGRIASRDGRSLQTRGAPTPRIGREKQDSSSKGSYGRARWKRTKPTCPAWSRTPSRLPYIDVFSQYRKLMEEALTKEPIPFSYREQVKEYFKSLEPR